MAKHFIRASMPPDTEHPVDNRGSFIFSLKRLQKSISGLGFLSLIIYSSQMSLISQHFTQDSAVLTFCPNIS